MINQSHKYKVVNTHGMVLVTHDDYAKAQQFVKNLSKERGLKLQIKHQEKTGSNKNVRP